MRRSEIPPAGSSYGFEASGTSGVSLADPEGISPSFADFTGSAPDNSWAMDNSSNSWGTEVSMGNNPFSQFGQEMQSTQERRETLRSKVGNRLGKIAATVGDKLGKVKDLFKGSDVRGTFGVGGKVDNGLASARGYTKRADDIANGRTARMASHVPLVGKHVQTAREVVGAVKATADLTGVYSGYAGGVEQAWDNRGDITNQATNRTREAAKDVARGGASAVLGELGLGFEGGRLRVESKRQLGRRAFELATGVGVVKVGGDVLRAGATGARSAAEAHAQRARDDVLAATGW